MEGHFQGGPMHGLTYTLRGEGDVLAVDPELGLAWLYRRLLNQPAGEPNYALDLSPGKGDPVTGARVYDEQASIDAVEVGLDVIVIPGEAPTQDEIDHEEVLTDGE